ncbi:dimeric dihydrodiol dehydrogenase [Penicillium malachiteum]|nr:dimeric dihydrodiol dehydrogenase [Penicillium malachiteum]
MELRWGILETVFANDLLVHATSRRVTDITHVLAGVASSSSLAAAKQLLQAINGPPTCRLYDKYSDLVLDPDIDIVYIASPHSHHFKHAMLALGAGKHVLCEKPFTVNADQARKLFSVAARKGLFLMEGMWTRFQPIAKELQQTLQDRTIGAIIRVIADNGLGVDGSTEWPPNDRMMRRELGGGALLDLGAYPIHWILQILGQNNPLDILSTVSTDAETGVDASVSILMSFAPCDPTDPDILTIANATLPAADNYDGNTPVVRIQGERGEIQLFGPAWRPSKICVIKREQSFGAAGTLSKTVENEIPESVQGLCFEADEAAQCIREGRVESPLMPWKQSLIAMKIMDKVRKDNGLHFPSDIESLDYPFVLSSYPKTGLRSDIEQPCDHVPAE